MKTKYFSYLILILIVIGMNGCSKSSSYVPVSTNPGSGGNPGGGGTTSPGANEVWMQNTAFNPSTKTITAGTTITWTNKDAASHDVSSLTGVFTSPSMGMGATFSFTFTTVGTYNYTCVFHQGMNGTIIVQ